MERSDSDAIFLTYDQPLEYAIFSPNSTFSQGRNRLLEAALHQGHDYLYYIFCDDDIGFLHGDWDAFEQQLLTYMPAVGVPMVPKTRHLVLPGLPHQLFTVNDEQLLALHHDVVRERIVVPYQTQFDHLHWWASCEIQEILIQTFYGANALQFNTIRLTNDQHNRYQHGDASFRKTIRVWLRKQLSGRCKSLRHNVFWGIPTSLYRTMLFFLRRRAGTRQPILNAERINKILAPDSELWQQWDAGCYQEFTGLRKKLTFNL